MQELKDFLTNVGATEFVEKLSQENLDQKALAQEFVAKFGDTLLQTKSKELKEAAKRDGQLATYSIVEGQIIEEFKELGLDPEQFKDVKDGKAKTLLQAAKKMVKAQIDAAKVEGKSADLVQLQAKMTELNQQLAENKAKADSIPQLLAQREQEVEAKYFLQSKIEEAIPEKSDIMVSKDMLKSYISAKVKLVVVADDKGNKSIEIRDLSGNLIPKSATAMYVDLKDYIENEIVTKENLWVRKGNEPNFSVVTITSGAPNPKSNVAANFNKFANSLK